MKNKIMFYIALFFAFLPVVLFIFLMIGTLFAVDATVIHPSDVTATWGAEQFHLQLTAQAVWGTPVP